MIEFASALEVALVPVQLGGGGLLWWAIALFVLAILAAAAGFTGVAGISMDIAKWLVIIFVVLAVIALLL